MIDVIEVGFREETEFVGDGDEEKDGEEWVGREERDDVHVRWSIFTLSKTMFLNQERTLK